MVNLLRMKSDEDDLHTTYTKIFKECIKFQKISKKSLEKLIIVR
jgi:hypothetical protein